MYYSSSGAMSNNNKKGLAECLDQANRQLQEALAALATKSSTGTSANEEDDDDVQNNDGNDGNDIDVVSSKKIKAGEKVTTMTTSEKNPGPVSASASKEWNSMAGDHDDDEDDLAAAFFLKQRQLQQQIAADSGEVLPIQEWAKTIYENRTYTEQARQEYNTHNVSRLQREHGGQQEQHEQQHRLFKKFKSIEMNEESSQRSNVVSSDNITMKDTEQEQEEGQVADASIAAARIAEDLTKILREEMMSCL